MLLLALSVICSTALVVLFKVFDKYRVPVFQAIAFNYLVATVCGLVFMPSVGALSPAMLMQYRWLWLSLLLGFMFIVVFSITSISTIQRGVGVTSVAYKLGLIFPVLLAFTLYGEPFNWLQLAGIVMAFAAVIFSSFQPKQTNSSHGSAWLKFLPLLVFLGSGACDSLTQLANKNYLQTHGMEEFSVMLFVAAAITGAVVLTWRLATGKDTLSWRALAGGTVMGIVNYFSFLWLLKALSALSWGSAVIFPVNNLAIVALAALTGRVVFKEKLSRLNQAGLGLAILAIVAILLSNYF